MDFVLVHGLGLNSNVWSRLKPILPGPVIEVDLPGHGKSNVYEYDWETVWETVSEKVTEYKWGETVLVLHSFSGALLPEIHDSSVMPAKVILLEAILHPADAIWTTELNLLNTAQFELWLPRFRSVASMTLKSQLFTRHDAKDIALWSEGFRIVHGDALRAMATNLVRRVKSGAPLNALHSMKHQVVFVRGCRSRLSEIGLSRIQDQGVEVVEISDSSHFPMLDNPDDLVSAILQ